jgi:heme exporter protein D
MSELQSFLAMGGYGAYVWPAYAITALAFGLMVVWALRGRGARRREEQQLAALGRRSRRGDRS